MIIHPDMNDLKRVEARLRERIDQLELFVLSLLARVETLEAERSKRENAPSGEGA